MADALLPVQVCYALPERQLCIDLQVALGSTIADAVALAMPDIDLTRHRVGIFARLKTPETTLRAHDRIEIYRPLVADPKDARRRRARKET
ncbi:putative ubiquitin-RnfH superfamily antitoxin RatB of RatAB toxin-antitoxin module [Actimicrobium sp. GrIS 1.19]|uniref:RnfH family protein n=1 Tax=Actimicrobium sp. GrIS 1.19 TaxID=3071708 RepID=UPI002DFFBF24|nr:putative ubiquitin-RnfH superfamily antitoxin RatB of RatAB toxin-antitoxin module [Actimicrobium sp. GrIS 1.19]